ncbi:MAG TPA: hypothetical protein VHB50_18525 [Bryobacteraceae bacterium]|nr:hypothetical protein [Bryobacteraceae bacterium]
MLKNFLPRGLGQWELQRDRVPERAINARLSPQFELSPKSVPNVCAQCRAVPVDAYKVCRALQEAGRNSPYQAGAVEVHFTPYIEAKLARCAEQSGRNPDEVVQAVIARYFAEEARFVESVTLGEDALQRGEYLTHEQVGQRLDRFLRS